MERIGERETTPLMMAATTGRIVRHGSHPLRAVCVMHCVRCRTDVSRHARNDRVEVNECHSPESSSFEL
jgi:hypothetical protein